MKKLSHVDIESFLKSYQDKGMSPGISFTPVVDNVTRFEDYTARALAGNFSRVVSVSQEGSPVVLTSSAACDTWNKQQ